MHHIRTDYPTEFLFGVAASTYLTESSPEQARQNARIAKMGHEETAELSIANHNAQDFDLKCNAGPVYSLPIETFLDRDARVPDQQCQNGLVDVNLSKLERDLKCPPKT